MPKIAIITIHALLLATSCAETPVGTAVDAGSDTGVDVTDDAEVNDLSEVGQPCAGPRDCVEGALCIGLSEGGFMCMAECTVAYRLCDSGVCLPLTPRPESICYIGGRQAEGAVCQTNLDCQPGLLCVGSGDEFRCADACADADDCQSGEFCKLLDTGASVCASFVGESCMEGTLCENPDLTCTAADPAWKPALPTDICTSIGCQTCGPNSLCMMLDGAPDDLCLPQCRTDADCRFTQGFRCQDAAFCAGQMDPTACREVLGNASLCLPE